ncbi:MAG: glutathione S-transferase N-terminal domain-containing protein [Xanthomonadales bacterium]|nr:glutathione S-transferase N-terminal domain-containing protein [Xanthomonadales bacterium]
MTGRRLLLFSLVLFLLPIVVAWYGLSVASAIGLVLLMLLWRWGISLSAIAFPARVPELELETISVSHFVEKVRWCLDRLGVEYREKPVGGTLGAFFLARTVPLLKFRCGRVRSSIGNSAEILRYLWGRYAAERPEQAEFLRPTPERLAFESRVDRCGVDLQVWVYHHMLPSRELTLRAWGAESAAIPAWQRLTLKALFPLLRVMIRQVFRITPAHYAKTVEHVNKLLDEVEANLADGRQSILGGDEVNYTDMTFAAIMGLWALPANFGAGRADDVRVDPARWPPAMQDDVRAWKEAHPRATAFIERLYESRA